MVRILSLLFVLGAWAYPQAQSVLYESPKKEAFFGDNGRAAFHSTALDAKGGLALAGTASRGPNGGTDIYLVKVDSNWQKQAERYLGRSKDDGAYRIVSRPNGGFLLIGYSEQPNRGTARSRYPGGRDGWLLWMSESGQSQAELLLGSTGEDELTDALPLPDGGWIAVGHADGRAWALRLGADKELLWQKYWTQPEGQAFMHSVAQINDRFYMVGRVGPAGNSWGWALCFNLNGDRLSSQLFPTQTLSEGHKIIATDNQQLAIVGEAYTRQGRLQGSWLLLDPQLGQLKVQHFGGRENDRFLSAARSYNGQWVLLGESHSYARGAREPKAWAVELDTKGQLLKERFYGSKSFDTGKALLQHPNGRWLMVGQSGQKILSSSQAWLWRASGKSTVTPPYPALQYDPVVYANKSNIAGSGDAAAFVPIRILGDSSRQQPLKARIVHIASGQAWEQQLVAGGGPSPTWYACPVPVPDSRTLGTERFEIQVLVAGQAAGSPHLAEAAFSSALSSNLSLQVREVPGTFAPGLLGQLNFTLSNHSDQTIYGLQLLGTGTACLPVQDTLPIGTLPPGSSLNYQAKLPVGNCAVSGLQQLRFRAVDESLTLSAHADVAIQVGSEGTPAPQTAVADANFITWLSPNPDQFDYLELVWNQPKIQIQIKVITSDTIRTQDFCLSINGQPCVSGTKFEEVRMSGSGRSRTFTQTIQLEEGENLLQGILLLPYDTLRTEPLKVVFTETRPNLHLLSIGVPSYDLEFTTQDARDFARLFQSETNLTPAFQHTFIDTLTTEQQTTKTAILKSLRRIQYRYANQQIQPNDLLVLFISSHGLSTPDGHFRIAASDYDNPFMEETSLDFETEIIDYLKSIPCRKLIFIDACHSGAAGNSPESEVWSSGTTLASLAERSRGIDLLLSCRADEYSYEDKRWDNGAFTEALVGSATLFKSQPSELDNNGDQQLSLQEWYAYLGDEIARLIAQKRPRPKSTQQPILHLADPQNDIILLKIKP